jgi:hypothetical protein
VTSLLVPTRCPATALTWPTNTMRQAAPCVAQGPCKPLVGSQVLGLFVMKGPIASTTEAAVRLVSVVGGHGLHRPQHDRGWWPLACEAPQGLQPSWPCGL